MDRNVETLAKRVKLMRNRRGLSQEALAEAAGLKQPDVSKIELGRILKTTAIARLAETLKVSPKWLEFGIGDPDPEAPGEVQPKGVEVTDEQELQVLHAFRTLLPDDRERIAKEILAKAEEMRRHTTFLLERSLVEPRFYQLTGRGTRVVSEEPPPKPSKGPSPPPSR